MSGSWPNHEEWLSRLVAFPTIAGGTNLDLVEHVRDALDGIGVPVSVGYDPTGTRADMLFTLGRQDEPGLLLSGHSDVVPVAGQDWTSDPFSLTLVNDRLVGRGACDMKGFLACVLASVPAMQAARLHWPIHVGISYDEELGCKGAPALVSRLKAELHNLPAGCIVGEPTGMKLVDAHKGKGGWRCIITGRAGHSALTHQGVNAVIAAAELIQFIRRLHDGFTLHGPIAEGFVPPHTTASVGRIEGGGQLNIIPEHCEFAFEFRTIPGEDPAGWFGRVVDYAEQEMLPGMRAVAPEASIRFVELIAYPGLKPVRDLPFRRLVQDLAEPGSAGKVAYGTDGGVIAAAGIPTLICGPGDMSVAHKPDEWIAPGQLSACMAFLDRLIAASVDQVSLDPV
ncbi:MAG TPA: acetylornithine deacetylase [Geminicoccus sp.]|jgi:acetylornithine deacetylase|uniref:acetylornithine deacetylase n=1 Tax=Geminicoccus sp. TaxID=2024832 RepID=UPI002E3323E0|nr:acetylornithine deacetylase [Geminicoccus sp.]HEX2529195.1 acetylornithine deacetylase [Geminicoccus sp.]